MVQEFNNKRVLLLGHQGMLWRAWKELLDASTTPYCSPDLEEFDFTRPVTLEATFAEKFDLVINAAAYTNVDGCETEESLAEEINASGVRRLAQCCADQGSTLVHYSTDYVFSGNKRTPYLPNTPRAPLNAYGRTKALGEQAVETSGCNYLLVRTSWLYAAWGKNFVRTIARLAGERDTIRVVNDQHGRPTSATHLAKTTWELLDQKARGTYHITDGGECCWYEFARKIIDLLDSECRVEPCTSAEFPLPAKRPAYSVLDLQKTESSLGKMPGWTENLQVVVGRLEPINY